MTRMHFSTESRVSDDAGNSVVVWRVEARAPEDRVSVATLVVSLINSSGSGHFCPDCSVDEMVGNLVYSWKSGSRDPSLLSFPGSRF